MRLLFCLYLLLLILRPQEFVPWMAGLQILQFLLLTCLGLWIFTSDKRLSLPQFPLLVLFLIFVPLTVGMGGWWGGIPTALGKLAPVVGIFIVASMAARDLRALHAYMWAILGCALLLVLHSAIQLHTGIGPITGARPDEGRPYYVGIFSDPNDLGQLFVIAMAFAIYLLAISQRRLARLFLFGSVAWLFYGMVLTDSRGALLAALMILALEGWRRYGKIAVGIAAALAVPALFAVTRLSQLSAGEQSANDRIQAWYEGLQMLRSHPVFGVGFENFTDHYSLTAHNFIVLPMAELGLPGLALWLGVIWYSMRMLWWVAYGPHGKVADAGPADAESVVAREVLAARGLFMACVGFGISAFFLSQSYKAPLFLLCGLAVARFAAATGVLPDPPQYRLIRDFPRLGVLTLACVAAIYLIVKVAL
jgi:putative inorganic carbon (HCO3(-)) transporter